MAEDNIDDLLDVEKPAAPEEPNEDAAPVALPETGDSVLDAHLRRQANWAKDAEEIFRGPTEDEQRRMKLLDDLAAIDAENAAKAKAEAEAKAIADEKAAAKENAAAKRAEAASLKAQIKALETEASRLEKLAKD